MSSRARNLLLSALVTSTALAVASCGGSTPSGDASGSGSGPLSVVAAFYPLQYAAEQIGGDAVTVTSLTEPGVEPHDLELTPTQVAQIADADLVLYIKGFQPAVDEAVEQQAADRALDVSDGIVLLAGDEQEHGEEGEERAGDDHADEEDGSQDDEHTGTDPHIWLAPENMAAIGQAIAERLVALMPSATGVQTRADTFATTMAGLNETYASGLATCKIHDLVTSHEAFGYLAAAFGFEQVGISGLSPEAEPSPARLAEVADFVRDHGITTIYYETLVDPKIASTIADEAGVTTAVLDPIEGLAPDSDADYVSIMEQNLASLRAGQNCT